MTTIQQTTKILENSKGFIMTLDHLSVCLKSLEKPLSVSARISVRLLGDVIGGRNVT